MHQDYIDIFIHLIIALLAGSLIGMERTFSGRPAGFRTHALVCVASALLMLVTTYQHLWLHTLPVETIRTDPTRMAQGIMTGIGFLGAGVIFKEGLTVRGLTTAASIWMTAAIGTLIGIGFYFPGILATAITLGTLSVFRVVELRMPTRHFARSTLRFNKDRIMPEQEVRELLKRHRFAVARMNYYLGNNGTSFEYQMVIKTIDRQNLERLSKALLAIPDIVEFQLITVAN
jgi:putative Mg2+ transporter-C (MgtC) family protein